MRKSIALAVILLLVVGCASMSWQSRARAGVAALIDSWDLTMTSLGSVYKAGKLGATPEANEANKALAIMWGDRARLSLKAAAAAIDAADPAKYDEQLANVQTAIVALNELLKGNHASVDTPAPVGSSGPLSRDRSRREGLRDVEWYFGSGVGLQAREARQDGERILLLRN